MRFKNFAYTCLLVGLAAANVEAGTMTTFLNPSKRFESGTFADLGAPIMVGGRVANGQPGVYQMDVTFSASTVAGEKGWANTLFDTGVVNLAGGAVLTLRPDFGWTGHNPNFDSNGASPGGIVPLYGTNQDAGAPGDLQGILVSIASATLASTDGRSKFGTAGAPVEAGVPGSGTGNPTYTGNFFVEWNGLGTADAETRNQVVAFTSDLGTFNPSSSTPGGSAGFGVPAIVPEPATLSLFGLAMVGFLGVARRRS